jgi:hypothetical protein
MNKMIIIALLGIAVLGASCNRKDCWKCTTVFTDSKGPSWVPPGTSAARASYCDKTEAEIRQIEKDGTGVQTYTQNGKTQSSSAVTTCK